MEPILKRVSETPILLPELTSSWECAHVFNPGVIYHRGLFHMFYRAQGLDQISRIGYAISENGIHWNRSRHPVLVPSYSYEAWGVEDPRVVEIEGTFYMTYTAYGPPQGQPTIAGGAIVPMVARSSNLIHWERLAPIVHGEDNKDHVLFPKRLKDWFVAVHRPRPWIALAFSKDLRDWPRERMVKLLGPRDDNWWDNVSVGANGVPIETDHGWLLFYHAYDRQRVYRFGVALLDLDDPRQVRSRPKDPVFWPEMAWEKFGNVPNVVFSCANIVVGDSVYVFYGGADHVIGLAVAPLQEVIDFALHG